MVRSTPWSRPLSAGRVPAMPLDKTGPILTTRKPLLADLAPLHAHVSVTATPEREASLVL
ncbi:hypothetical protein GCM10022267_63140 [Lentzea roselyniae]|uniref:Uncharacterized protein n=1 Tax=Lentzea roselyniae TaxID=531940 RepID=A0ABP7BRD0_9PSEU